MRRITMSAKRTTVANPYAGHRNDHLGKHAVEQRDATDKGREVCPLRPPLMGAVVEGGLCS